MISWLFIGIIENPRHYINCINNYIIGLVIFLFSLGRINVL